LLLAFQIVFYDVIVIAAINLDYQHQLRASAHLAMANDVALRRRPTRGNV
jgi:hypothetical protein